MPELTAFEEALRAIPAENWELTLSTMETVYKNAAQNPAEDKYRKIK